MKSLPANHTLRELDLTCNRINVFSLRYLLDGLEKNDTLETLLASRLLRLIMPNSKCSRCLFGLSFLSPITTMYSTDLKLRCCSKSVQCATTCMRAVKSMKYCTRHLFQLVI